MAYGADRRASPRTSARSRTNISARWSRPSMNRCIQCTRCVRFVTEVAGVPELGAIGRGEDMEITSYLEQAMTSELQGNVIDLCPVGALTSKPTAFHARPWEYDQTESVDVMDALGSAIRIDSRGREVVRILPRINDAINEEWISDKTRFVVRRTEDPAPRPALCAREWQAEARELGARPSRRSPPRSRRRLADEDRRDCRRPGGGRGNVRAQGPHGPLGSPNIDCRQDGAKLHPKFGRASYLFNSTIAGIDQADAILIIGSNPRREAPVLNARIRKRWLKGGLPVGVIGERADLTYDYDYLGAGAGDAGRLAQDHPPVRARTKPMFIVGPGALARGRRRSDAGDRSPRRSSLGASRTAGTASTCCTPPPRGSAASISASCRARAASTRVGMAQGGALDVLFNLGADEIDVEPGAFVVYIGTHGDRGAHRADVILPGAAYTEKTGIYVNTEGPAAVRRSRRLPARRRARGLVDPARAVGPARREAAVQFARAVARGARRRLSRISCASTRSLRPTRRLCAGGGARRRGRQGAVRLHHHGLLSDQPDRARLARHGRMLGPGAGRAGLKRRNSKMSSATPTRPASSLGLAVLGVVALSSSSSSGAAVA